MSATARGWLMAAAAVLAAFVGLALISEAFAPAPQGPSGSAYATSSGGVAAWAQLLTREGHPVGELRTELAHARPAPDATLVVLGADRLQPAAGRRLRAFVRRGGRLVIGGGEPASVLSTVTGAAPAWRPRGPRTVHRVASVPETRGVSRIVTSGRGGFSGSGHGSVALAGGGQSLLIVQALGRGRIATLADASPLENDGLAGADNAQLALDLAGPAGRAVVFAEALHGYTRATGLAAFPARWWVTIAGLALAAGAWALARGRRLGPPQRPGPEPVPPRAAYVDALARRLADGRSAAALARYAAAQAAGETGRDDAITDEVKRQAMQELYTRVRDEIGKVVVGQDAVLGQVMCALVCRGHVLLEGPPGVAKTLLARALARALGLEFARVPFTPDMLPSDLTGTMILRGGELVFRPGPVFTHVLLADEINRTPPKTQAALLQAMQEAQVSVDGEPHRLPDPFLVLATQNPIEYEGTYPLPEAQLDRFLMRVTVGYPDAAAERAMLALSRAGVGNGPLEEVQVVADRGQLLQVAAQVDATAVSDEVAAYVVAIVRRTRELASVSLGASPRATVHLLAATRAAARLAGRAFVTPDDVAAIAPAVLGHRLILTPEAELARLGAEQVIATVLGEVPVPR